MKFNVGDIVTVVDHLDDRNCRSVGYDVSMRRHEGKKVTIAAIINDSYKIKEDGQKWWWVDTMFKEFYGVTEKEEEKVGDLEQRKEIKAALNLDEMMKNGNDILDSCHIYNQTDFGMKKIEQAWLDAKLNTETWGNMSLFEVLSKHPNYVPDKGYIAFSNDWNRPVDKKTILSVISDLRYAASTLRKEVVFPGNRYYIDIYKSVRRLNEIADTLDFLPADLVKAEIKKLYTEDRKRLKRMLNTIQESSEYKIDGDCAYYKDSWNMYKKFTYFCDDIYSWVNSYDVEDNCIVIDEQFMEFVNRIPMEIKGLRVGQKLNKVLGKILKTIGLNTHIDYNEWLARLGDACSPIQFTRHTIISLNRNDYWTMSFGKDWCSCANIDKDHYRHSSKVGMYGDGCCSAGTESYMLDPSTVVMYTVDASYTGRDFELQDKINRCLFHLGDRKFVMGRVYPQGTDGEDEVYRQWREIFQKVISDCLGVTNFWKTEKDRDSKCRQYYSTGVHYEDYEMDYCDVAGWSYLKENINDVPSDKKIYIGHYPICPSCGKEHDLRKNIQCCGDNGHYCADCGGWCEYEEDMCYVDGEWYCEDCVSYCDYHEQYEHENLTYVRHYGNVCDDAIAYGDGFHHCDRCGDYFYGDEYIETRNGYIYCSEECAENDGAHYCSECNEWVESRYWNEEAEMCNDCAAERSDD